MSIPKETQKTKKISKIETYKVKLNNLIDKHLFNKDIDSPKSKKKKGILQNAKNNIPRITTEKEFDDLVLEIKKNVHSMDSILSELETIKNIYDRKNGYSKPSE